MSTTVLISGASSGIGRLAAHRLADAGHTVYAGMRAIADRNEAAAQEARDYSAEHGISLTWTGSPADPLARQDAQRAHGPAQRGAARETRDSSPVERSRAALALSPPRPGPLRTR